MHNLQETISFIKETYHQELIEMNDFDFSLNTNIRTSHPKFLFRGESTKWEKTQSTVVRQNLLSCSYFSEICYWMAGLDQNSGKIQNRNSLYLFLREVIWNIPCVDNNYDDIEIEKSIIAFFQHYGFDTSFIDLTSDINVAAFFASHNAAVKNIGEILIIPTQKIENRFFDLTNEQAQRPSIQKAYALFDNQQIDLKSSHFLNDTNSIWIPFQLTKEDKDHYQNPKILSIKNDNIAENIFEWFDCHICNSTIISSQVKEYFLQKN